MRLSRLDGGMACQQRSGSTKAASSPRRSSIYGPMRMASRWTSAAQASRPTMPTWKASTPRSGSSAARERDPWKNAALHGILFGAHACHCRVALRHRYRILWLQIRRICRYTPGQMFDFIAYNALRDSASGWSFRADGPLTFAHDLDFARFGYERALSTSTYVDAHAWLSEWPSRQ